MLLDIQGWSWTIGVLDHEWDARHWEEKGFRRERDPVQAAQVAQNGRHHQHFLLHPGIGCGRIVQLLLYLHIHIYLRLNANIYLHELTVCLIFRSAYLR